jgi:hypothetical protein
VGASAQPATGRKAPPVQSVTTAQIGRKRLAACKLRLELSSLPDINEALAPKPREALLGRRGDTHQPPCDRSKVEWATSFFSMELEMGHCRIYLSVDQWPKPPWAHGHFGGVLG